MVFVHYRALDSPHSIEGGVIDVTGIVEKSRAHDMRREEGKVHVGTAHLGQAPANINQVAVQYYLTTLATSVPMSPPISLAAS